MFWVPYLSLLANRAELHDDPLMFAVRDPVSLLCGALGVACAILAVLP